MSEHTTSELNYLEEDFILWLKNQKSKEIENFANPQWVAKKIDTGELDLVKLKREFTQWKLEQESGGFVTQIHVQPK